MPNEINLDEIFINPSEKASDIAIKMMIERHGKKLFEENLIEAEEGGTKYTEEGQRIYDEYYDEIYGILTS